MLNSNIIKLKVSDYPIQNGRIDKWIIEAFSLLNLSYPKDLKVNTIFSRTKIKDLILSGNIIIDGINLGLTFRNQFKDILEENDLDLDRAISEWKPLNITEQ